MSRHEFKTDMLRGAVPIETKDAGAGLSPELKAALEKFTVIATEVKTINEERIAGFEKKFADVVTEEKLNKALEGLGALREDFNKQFAELKRTPQGGGADDESAMERKLAKLRGIEKKAFGQYVRKDDRNAMHEAHKAGLSEDLNEVKQAYADELGIEIKDLSTIVAEDGGYLVLPEYEREKIGRAHV